MAAQKCSSDQALVKMASLLQSREFDQAEFTSLFDVAVQGDRDGACRSYIDGIETMLRRKMNPEAEIIRAYTILSRKTKAGSIMDVLNDLTIQTRLGRNLRRLSCRLLVNNSDAEIPIPILQDLASSGDAGRLTAVDFLVTRKRCTAEHAQLMVQTVNDLGKISIVSENQRRCAYITRLLKLTGTLESLAPKLPEAIRVEAGLVSRPVPQHIETIVSAADMKKCLPRLQNLGVEEMSHWLRGLRQALAHPNRKQTDKSRCAISNMLGNIARNYQLDPIVVDILALAIDIETMVPEPSVYIFDKLQRVAVAAHKHAGPAFTVLVQAIALCVKKLGYVPGQILCGECDPRLNGPAQILSKLDDWTRLTDAVFEMHDHQLRIVVAQLLILYLRSMPTKFGSTRHRDNIIRLMTLALQGSSNGVAGRIRLHEVYALALGECFDENEICSYIDNAELELSVRFTAGVIWAHAAPNASQAHQRCRRILPLAAGLDHKRNEVIERLIDVHAFSDIAHDLNVPFKLHDDELIPLDQLATTLTMAHYQMPPLAGIHAAHRAFQTLRNMGSHYDAYCALQTMLLRARELTGDNGIRFRAYRAALRKYMTDELELPESVLNTMVIEKYGDFETVPQDGLDNLVNEIMMSVLSKPNAALLKKFDKEYNILLDVLSNDPVLGLATESAMSIPQLATYHGRSVSSQSRKEAQIQISNLVQTRDQLSGLNWIDELKVTERMFSLNCIATSMRASPSLLSRIDPHGVEMLQGNPVTALRTYLRQETSALTGEIPSSIETRFTEPPNDVICVNLSFDSSNTLIITRREKGNPTVSLRLPESRTSSLTNSKRVVTYTQALTGVKKVINEAGAVEVTEDTAHERGRFWKQQYALDDELQKLLISIQRSWIAGFGTVLSSQPSALEVSDELLSTISKSIQRNVSKLSLRYMSLSPALGACIRNAALAESFDQMEDLLYALFDNLVLQGAAISVDEIDMRALMIDLKRQMRPYRPPKSEPKHIVLVCDRKASAIPWEMLPLFQECSVTRAVSLDQVAEWAHQRETSSSNKGLIRAQNVTAILNPQGDLPRTEEKFDTEFRLRGWQGFTGTSPTREQFLDAFTKSSSLVYVGHGSGSMLAEPAAVRRLFLTQTGVYLFGCSSVAVQYPFFNKDAMTSYAIAGSREIMGTLWNVKDKDCNRFTAEFLSRVFDEHEHIGKALWEARKACLLPYLTAAAWVLYGLP